MQITVVIRKYTILVLASMITLSQIYQVSEALSKKAKLCFFLLYCQTCAHACQRMKRADTMFYMMNIFNYQRFTFLLVLL